MKRIILIILMYISIIYSNEFPFIQPISVETNKNESAIVIEDINNSNNIIKVEKINKQEDENTIFFKDLFDKDELFNKDSKKELQEIMIRMKKDKFTHVIIESYYYGGGLKQENLEISKNRSLKQVINKQVNNDKNLTNNQKYNIYKI